jgi:glutamine synthetase type III
MSLMNGCKEQSFRVLLHEKPFRINGSGKHCKCLGADTGINLFSPGKAGRQPAFSFVCREHDDGGL